MMYEVSFKDENSAYLFQDFYRRTHATKVQMFIVLLLFCLVLSL